MCWRKQILPFKQLPSDEPETIFHANLYAVQCVTGTAHILVPGCRPAFFYYSEKVLRLCLPDAFIGPTVICKRHFCLCNGECPLSMLPFCILYSCICGFLLDSLRFHAGMVFPQVGRDIIIIPQCRF